LRPKEKSCGGMFTCSSLAHSDCIIIRIVSIENQQIFFKILCCRRKKEMVMRNKNVQE
jgi:hypothetical protein